MAHSPALFREGSLTWSQSPVVSASADIAARNADFPAVSPKAKRQLWDTVRENVGKEPLKLDHQTGRRFAYFAMMLLGASCLVPWKVIITAAAYFNDLYPGKRIEFWFPVAYMLPLLIGLIVLTLKGKEWDLHIRIFSSTIALSVSLGTFFIWDILMYKNVIGINGGFWGSLASLFCCGAAASVLQASLYGIAGLMGEEFAQALQTGKGWAGVSIVGLCLITKASFPNTFDGIRHATLIYLGIGCFVIVLSLALYVRLIRVPFARNVLAIYADLRKGNFDKGGEGQGLLGSTGISFADVVEQELEQVSIKEVFMKTWQMLFVVCMVFVVAIGLFPGMITSLPSTTLHLGNWFPIITIACFDVGDLFGKALPGYIHLFKQKTVLIGLLVQLCFIPLFILGVDYQNIAPSAAFFGNDIYDMAISLLLGAYTGYLGCSCMMLGPSVVKEHERETAGMLDSIFLITGLFLGAWLGMLLGAVAVPDNVGSMSMAAL